MKSKAFRTICRLLVLTMLALPFSRADAGMIDSSQVASRDAASANRAAVAAFFSRAKVASELEARGVDPRAAQERVAAMSDAEIETLHGAIDELPAGAMLEGVGASIGAIALALAFVIAIAILMWKKAAEDRGADAVK